ncbi:reticulon-4 receptor-like 2 [Mytilus trossulus]|uniref:reticulon-4 receptor-like 2 n=1 Tax=Mytilus trossulus TaxID=6551 RepID=UPI00300671C6
MQTNSLDALLANFVWLLAQTLTPQLNAEVDCIHQTMNQTILLFMCIVLKSTVFGCPSVCICNGTTVICTDKNLTTVPSGIPTLTTNLYLDNNQLTSINGTAFQGLKSLLSLKLNKNLLASLDENVFHDLTALQDLYLDENQLTSLNGTPFQGLTSLISLKLQKNYLVMLDENVFEDLTALQHLVLNNNQLTSISGTVFQGLKALLYLYLDENQLTSLNGTPFQGLTSLIIL